MAMASHGLPWRLRFAFHMARRLKEQRRFVEAEELLRWAVDGLRTEIGEGKIAAGRGGGLGRGVMNGDGVDAAELVVVIVW